MTPPPQAYKGTPNPAAARTENHRLPLKMWENQELGTTTSTREPSKTPSSR